MPFGPVLVKQNNPEQLYGFTTDRTFISYFKNKIFIDNYKKPFPLDKILNIPSPYHVRDLIYMGCYSDIEKEPKDVPNPWRDYIKIPFYSEILPHLRQRFPLIYDDKIGIKQCELDIDFLVNL